MITLKNLLKHTFSFFRLNSKQVQKQLSLYRPWSFPLNAYNTLNFEQQAESISLKSISKPSLDLSLFQQILKQRYNLNEHNNLVDKIGLYILARNPSEITESQLKVFANVEFKEIKNPLTLGNIEHIIQVSIARKDISLQTKLLLCLKSSSNGTLNKGVIQDISKQIDSLGEKEVVEVLILLKKCIEKINQEEQFNEVIIDEQLHQKILNLKGNIRIIGQSVLNSCGLIKQIDQQNIYSVIESNQLTLQSIYCLFSLKDMLTLTPIQYNKVFQALFTKLPQTNKQNSWMIVNIFSQLTIDQKLYVMNKLPIQQFHPSDYVMYLEIIEQSEFQVQICGNHNFPYWIKNEITAKEFERLLLLRFELKYDNQNLIPQIVNYSFNKNLVCFKGLIHFLNSINMESQVPLSLIAKNMKEIIKVDKIKNYDIVQFYNVITLMAKYNFCKNKFWREIQKDLIQHTEQAIQLSNYLSMEQKEQFLSQIVLLLKNIVGRSNIEGIILDELKSSLGEMWSIQGLNELAENLSIVGMGDPELWSIIEENLEMVRPSNINKQILGILKIMLRMNKGSGYYWRRIAESLPLNLVEELRAQALKMEEKTISNYLKQGYAKRKPVVEES